MVTDAPRDAPRTNLAGTIFHSPTERGAVIRSLTRLGKDIGVKVRSSGLPEPRGVDFMWMDEAGDFRGVQRKELHDFLASLDDGRLAKEIAQMNAHVTLPALVLEGRLTYANGSLVTNKWNRSVSYASMQRRLVTIANKGVSVFTTSEASQTAEWIIAFYQWTMSGSHETASHRPKPTNDWGKMTNRDWQIHMMQGIDGIGHKTAAAIIDTLGRCPIQVDATVEELMMVPGVGRATAARIIHSVNGKPEKVSRVAKKPRPPRKLKRGGA